MDDQCESLVAVFRDSLARVMALAPLIRRRKASAGRVVDRLLALPRQQQERLIEDRRSTRIRSRATLEELIGRISKAAFEDPNQAEIWGELAEELLFFTPKTAEATGGERGWIDLSSRLWAHRANIARIRCHWEQAHQRFDRAYLDQQSGSGDPLLEAEVLWLHASLLMDQKHFRAALRCLTDAEKIYKGLGRRDLLAKALLKRAYTCRNMKCHTEALQVQFEACKHLDSFEEPELSACAWINLALYLCELGRHEKAEEILLEHQPLLRLCKRRSTVHLNHSWVWGLTAQRLGRMEEAENCYRRALNGYREMANPYDEALVSLDLGSLYAEQGRQEELASLIEEAWAALRNQKLHKEAARALELLLSATRQRKAAVEVIRAAGESLRQFRLGAWSCSR